MNKNKGPIKDRIDEKISKMELLVVQNALFAYLKEVDPKVEKVQFKDLLLEMLLPYLVKLDPNWEGMLPKNFVTSYKSINQAYHSVRNQFFNMELLRQNVDAYVPDDEESDES